VGDNFNKLVSNIHLSERTLDHLEFTYEDYLNYLKTIDELDEFKKNLFLKTLKNREIVNNQETEMEESFMVELYNISRRKDSVDIVMQIIEDGSITPQKLSHRYWCIMEPPVIRSIEDLDKLMTGELKGVSDETYSLADISTAFVHINNFAGGGRQKPCIVVGSRYSSGSINRLLIIDQIDGGIYTYAYGSGKIVKADEIDEQDLNNMLTDVLG
jgi:hypothetical protein